MDNYYKIIIALLITINSDKKNRVLSHNDLESSSVYVNNDQVSFVDWEYSGKNHRSYDLTLFSIKSSLSSEQENDLTNTYDAKNTFDTKYFVTLMKPIIYFLYMLWKTPKNSIMHESLYFLNLNSSLQEAIFYQSSRVLFSEAKIKFNDSKSEAHHSNVARFRINF